MSHEDEKKKDWSNASVGHKIDSIPPEAKREV